MTEKNIPLFTISIVARIVGLQPRALRLYEEMGIITPTRREKGHRLYTQEEVERLAWVRDMATMRGINLAGIKFILDLMEQLRIELSDLEEIVKANAKGERK
jgi:MerR family transcriptional regulator/heat shock protein HspR